jgi:CRISPR/Cas system-associated exonuclease Cas4 (RecB family)
MIIVITLFIISLILGLGFLSVRQKVYSPLQVIPELKRGARLIYCDESRRKIFVSHTYRIRACPDFIYQNTKGEMMIVEFKSRIGGIKASDVNQLIATAIAVKSTYPTIRYGYIYTRSKTYRKVDLHISLPELVEKIMPELSACRAIAHGNRPYFKAVVHKCRKCLYRSECHQGQILVKS